MLTALVIFVGLLPAGVSLIVGWFARKSFQENIAIATDRASTDRLRYITRRPRHPDEHYVDGMGLVIGDITCQMNARSQYIRCTANPFGPCEGCTEYEGKDYD
ncbi:MAG: DUF6464 family protein [Phormidesmis sp.]